MGVCVCAVYALRRRFKRIPQFSIKFRNEILTDFFFLSSFLNIYKYVRASASARACIVLRMLVWVFCKLYIDTTMTTTTTTACYLMIKIFMETREMKKRRKNPISLFLSLHKRKRLFFFFTLLSQKPKKNKLKKK